MGLLLAGWEGGCHCSCNVILDKHFKGGREGFRKDWKMKDFVMEDGRRFTVIATSMLEGCSQHFVDEDSLLWHMASFRVWFVWCCVVVADDLVDTPFIYVALWWNILNEHYYLQY